MGFNSRVYEIVRQIPDGKVASYGQIAYMAGSWRASRAVGYAMHSSPDQARVPCHRVVFKDGGLAPGCAFGSQDMQRQLLEDEGVIFTADGRVDMVKCCWDPAEARGDC
jgi:methylated-DNA-protein-cysteine methyltransferase related protein